jgi:hypothetical protein
MTLAQVGARDARAARHFECADDRVLDCVRWFQAQAGAPSLCGALLGPGRPGAAAVVTLLTEDVCLQAKAGELGIRRSGMEAKRRQLAAAQRVWREAYTGRWAAGAVEQAGAMRAAAHAQAQAHKQV